jgi:predicted transcriptional regulator
MNRDFTSPSIAEGTLKLQDTIRLSANGVAKVLGDLEARVLQAVWELGGAHPARGVYEVVCRDHAVAQLTVITVLNKLVTKGLLIRERENDLYHYRAALTREEFMIRMSRRVVEGILSLGPRAVAASMVDVLAESDPEQLEELARLVHLKLKDKG